MGGGCQAGSVVVSRKHSEFWKADRVTLVCDLRTGGGSSVSVVTCMVGMERDERNWECFGGPRMARRSSGVWGTRSGACGPLAGGPPPAVHPLVSPPLGDGPISAQQPSLCPRGSATHTAAAQRGPGTPPRRLFTVDLGP